MIIVYIVYIWRARCLLCAYAAHGDMDMGAGRLQIGKGGTDPGKERGLWVRIGTGLGYVDRDGEFSKKQYGTLLLVNFRR